MDLTATATAAAPTSTARNAAAPVTVPRRDLYVGIHKALRHGLTDTLLRCGRLDGSDPVAQAATLAQLDELLGLCARHLQHEDDFLHPAIEARQPGAARRAAGEHAQHLEHIAALHEDARQLGCADAARRPALALRLYRHLALFVADSFQHMHLEETAHNAALWAHYSDAALDALHDRLMASLPPQEVLQVLRWMLPALGPAEGAELLRGVRAGAPPEAFLGVLAHVRPHLDDASWARLAPALGVAQQPGLVDCR